MVALHALPAIDPTVAGPVGGTETRAWTFARGRARRDGCDVSFVVRADRQRPPFQQDGVTVIARRDRLYGLYEAVGKCVEKSARFPGVRLRKWEWPLLWQLPALAACRAFEGKRRDVWRRDAFYTGQPADLFVTFGVQANSARVIASAHAVSRPAVLMIGSDGDLDARYQPGSTYVSPYGDVAGVCYEILQRADAVVVQTHQQQQILRDRFRRESTVIANPIDLVRWDAQRNLALPPDVTCGFDRYALWVGRAESVHKRPELLLEVARLCPQVPFVMILNPRDRAVEQRVVRGRPDNVQVVSHVPVDQMPAVFAKAAVFVSTSALEGFPNVFLQAAASGVPIASLEVGEDFITAARCGICAHGELSRLAEYVNAAWADPRAETAQRAREYVAAHHGLQSQAARLESVLRDVLATKQCDARCVRGPLHSS
jgi:glycosyltransferase involved in cell wall biosynthesis